MHGRGRGLGLLHAMARRLEHDRDRASLCGLVPGGRTFAAEVLSEVSDEAEPSERKRSAFAALLSLAALAAYVAATVVSDGAAPVLSRVAGGDLTGLFAGAVVFGSLVPLVCAVPSRGRLLPAACGFISIAAGAVLLQWTVQCLGLPAWQFFAR